jgi:hypothetical protein
VVSSLSGLLTKILYAFFIFAMHFIVTWLCAVQRGKGTGHPTPFNSWLSTPRSGGMGCAVHGHVCNAGMCVHVHLVLALYRDPTILWADNCKRTHACAHTHYMPCSSHPPQLDHPTNIW